MGCLAIIQKGLTKMEFTIAGVVALGLLGYLAYALFHPERFR